MSFKYKNAISMTYLSLIGIILLLCSIFFGFSNVPIMVGTILIGPYQFNYNHLCCLGPESNTFIKSAFFAVTCFGVLCYLVRGYASRKWLIILANFLGITSVFVWHFFMIIFTLIGGLKH